KYCFSMEFEANKMTLSVSTEITEPGNYTFHVPSGFYDIDGVAATENHSFEYTIIDGIETEIITEQPAGTRVDCQTEFLSWYVVNDILGGMPLDGKPTHYVIGEDDCLYLYNPILLKPYGAQQTGSYIKGVKNGDNYVFSFPQPVATDVIDGVEEVLYVNFMKNVPYENGSTYVVNEENNSYTFKILENGDCVPTAESDELYIVGYTDSEGDWLGFGNVDMKYLKFNYTAHEIPANATVQDWIMEYSKGGSEQRLQSNVQVVIKDNEIWVKGFSQTYCPDAWAYGTIDNDDIIHFDPYLGEATSVGQYAFVYNGLVNSDSNLIWPLEMVYEPENKKIYDGEDLLINPNQVFYYTLENYVLPVLTDNSIELTTKVPKAPKKINNFFILDSDTGYSSISVNLASENLNDQPLNPANLYYQILLPGFKSYDVYTFTPELYSEIDEPLTDIPFNMTSGIVFGTGIQRNMYVYVPDYDNIGARMIYKDETGEYFSAPTFFYPVDYDDSVNEIDADASIVQTKWYNLEGLHILSPEQSGLYIRKDIFDDGSVRTTKIYLHQ
ncbi:MAG: hypothetical protein K2G67_06985, partial [Muribaculaceae bacterium]|nr:hypothetical protein [Muribaculaceae bacterium]